MEYQTGEQILLGDHVEVLFAGIPLSGVVVYIQGEGCLYSEFQWCVDENLKNMIVQWDNPNYAKSFLYIGDEPEKIANFIQTDNDEELILKSRIQD